MIQRFGVFSGGQNPGFRMKPYGLTTTDFFETPSARDRLEAKAKPKKHRQRRKHANTTKLSLFKFKLNFHLRCKFSFKNHPKRNPKALK